MLALVLTLAAFAAADEVTQADDGTVSVVAQLPGAPDAVRALLADPVRSNSLNPDTISIAVDKVEGPCEQRTVETKGMFRPLVYTVQRCTKDDGFEEKLVRSEDFTDYYERWTVTPDGEGSRVEFRIRVGVNLPVPTWMVQRGLRGSAADTVDNLRKALQE